MRTGFDDPYTPKAIALLFRNAQHFRLDNRFDLVGQDAVSPKSTRGLIITGNRFSTGALPVHVNACTKVSIENNQLNAKE